MVAVRGDRKNDRSRPLGRPKKEAEEASRDELEFVSFEKSECAFTIEKKAHGEGRMMYEGYASVFGNIDSYNDIIDAGAFSGTLKERGPKEDASMPLGVSSLIKSLWQHNPDWPLGLPLHAEEDSKGLFHRTAISNTQENRDRVEYMSDGVVSTQSIGFITLDAELEDEEDIWSVRHLKELFLFEWSPVTFAANEEAITTVVMKSRELAKAVLGRDQGKILALAQKMNGVVLPQIEESLAILTRFSKDLDLSGVEDPDTSEEDPALVGELEGFSEEVHSASSEAGGEAGGSEDGGSEDGESEEEKEIREWMESKERSEREAEEKELREWMEGKELVEKTERR